MIELFAENSPFSVEALQACGLLDDLKSRIANENYLDPYREFFQAASIVETIRLNALDVCDESLANACYVFKRYFKVFADLADFFGMLDEKSFEKSWDRLQDCIDGVDMVCRFLSVENAYDLPEIRLHLQQYEALYPYRIFASSEFIVEKSHCSICGESMQSLSCMHRKGHLYGGQLAAEVIDRISEVHAVAMVLHPSNKRCVLKPVEEGDDKIFFKKLEDFMSLEIPKLQRFSLDEGVVRDRNQNVVKVGRNEPCSCGSGLKFKRCCEKKLYRERIYYTVRPGSVISLHLFKKHS